MCSVSRGEVIKSGTIHRCCAEATYACALPTLPLLPASRLLCNAAWCSGAVVPWVAAAVAGLGRELKLPVELSEDTEPALESLRAAGESTGAADGL